MATVLPVKSSAIVADYPQMVIEQKAAAEAHVTGKVVSAEYTAGKGNIFQYVSYDVLVKEVEKGDFVSVGAIVSLNHNCDMASEMFKKTTKSECIENAPKVGDDADIYINKTDIICDQAPCPQYRQAVIYEDEIVNINNNLPSTDNDNMFFSFIVDNANVIAAVTVIVGAGVLAILHFGKSKCKKSTKKSKK